MRLLNGIESIEGSYLELLFTVWSSGEVTERIGSKWLISELPYFEIIFRLKLLGVGYLG